MNEPNPFDVARWIIVFAMVWFVIYVACAVKAYGETCTQPGPSDSGEPEWSTCSEATPA